MISYHPDSANAPVGTTYTSGFETDETTDIERIARGILEFSWSGNVWAGGYRNKANFLYSDYCVLDIDDETHSFSIEQAVKSFSDMIHIIGETRNHRRDKKGSTCDRYRVVIPWEKRIEERSLYEGNMQALKLKYDSLDASTLSGAQHFFRCTKIVSIATEGYKQEVKNKRYNPDDMTDLEYCESLEAKRAHFEAIGRLPNWVIDFLNTGKAAPGRRHYLALGAAQEMLELGLPFGLVMEKIGAAPISREYRQGEVADIVRYAQQRIMGRLRNGEEGTQDRKSDHLPGYNEADYRGESKEIAEASRLPE